MSNFEAFKSWQFWWGHSFRVLQPCTYHVIFNILYIEGEYARFICSRYKAFFSSLPAPYLIITIGSVLSHPVSSCKPLKPFHVSYLEFWCKSYNTSNCRFTLWFHDTYLAHIVSHNINRSPMCCSQPDPNASCSCSLLGYSQQQSLLPNLCTHSFIVRNNHMPYSFMKSIWATVNIQILIIGYKLIGWLGVGPTKPTLKKRRM